MIPTILNNKKLKDSLKSTWKQLAITLLDFQKWMTVTFLKELNHIVNGLEKLKKKRTKFDSLIEETLLHLKQLLFVKMNMEISQNA